MDAFSNFFRINMPYGVIFKANGQIVCFNREYAPLGHLKSDESYFNWANESDLPIFGNYQPVSDNLLRKIAIDHKIDVWGDDTRVIWLYLDESNPTNHPKSDKKWKAYFDRIRMLSELGVFSTEPFHASSR